MSEQGRIEWQSALMAVASIKLATTSRQIGWCQQFLMAPAAGTINRVLR
jgi:hypothetical protein